MRIVSRLIIVGTIFYIVAILNQILVNAEITTNLEHEAFRQSEESSGNNFEAVDEDVKSIKSVFNLKSTVDVLPSGKIYLSISFDAKFSLHENFDKNALVKAFARYVNDLFAKFKLSELSIRVEDLFLTTSSTDFTNFHVKSECQSLDQSDTKTKNYLELRKKCQLAISKVIPELKMNEILIYFNEFGHTEDLIQPVNFEPLNDFYFIANTESVEINTSKMYDGSLVQLDGEEAYHEENYVTIASNEYEELNVSDSDFFVDSVKPLTDNEFDVLAFITPVLNITEMFKDTFKSYVENSHKSIDTSLCSNITVTVLSAVENEFGNETVVEFVLKTFKINITEEDLSLDHYTTFDHLFEFFNVTEFATLLSSDKYNVGRSTTGKTTKSTEFKQSSDTLLVTDETDEIKIDSKQSQHFTEETSSGCESVRFHLAKIIACCIILKYSNK